MKTRLHFVTEWDAKAITAHYKVADLARLVGVSVSQLERFFVETRKLTPHEWMNRSRQMRAPLLLAEGKSVKATAYELGYRQSSHFSREFKRFHGTPPREMQFGGCLEMLKTDMKCGF